MFCKNVHELNMFAINKHEKFKSSCLKRDIKEALGSLTKPQKSRNSFTGLRIEEAGSQKGWRKSSVV